MSTVLWQQCPLKVAIALHGSSRTIDYSCQPSADTSTATATACVPGEIFNLNTINEQYQYTSSRNHEFFNRNYIVLLKHESCSKVQIQVQCCWNDASND